MCLTLADHKICFLLLQVLMGIKLDFSLKVQPRSSPGSLGWAIQEGGY